MSDGSETDAAGVLDAVRRYRTPVVLALGVARDEEASTTLAVHCAEATGRYRLQAARMLAALLPDEVLARAVEAAEAQEHQDRAQGALFVRRSGARIVDLPTGGEN